MLSRLLVTVGAFVMDDPPVLDTLFFNDFLGKRSSSIVSNSSCFSVAKRMSNKSPFSDWVGSGYENG